MKKRNFFRIVALAAFAAVAMTSCNKQNAQADEKPASASQASGDVKFAYVVIELGVIGGVGMGSESLFKLLGADHKGSSVLFRVKARTELALT